MKLDLLQEKLRSQNLRAAIWYSKDWDPDTYYFTHYEGSGWLVVPVHDSPFLIVPRMELERAQDLGLRVVLQKKPMLSGVKEFLDQVSTSGSHIGVVKSQLSWGMSENIKLFRRKWIDISGLMENLRILKTQKEIEFLEDGCALTEKILKKVIHNWSNYRTETDVACELEYWTKQRGLQVSFPTIVASGLHARVPHHITLPTKLQRGMCVIDFGIRYKGYCTDISRTVCIKKASPEMENIYYLVRDAQQAAIDAVKSGSESKVIDGISRNSLGNYKQFFIHGLGHGIGVEVHEPPWIHSTSTHTLRDGMCLTIEPGVYTKNGGVRIEDDIHVLKNGCKLLTTSSKNLITLD